MRPKRTRRLRGLAVAIGAGLLALLVLGTLWPGAALQLEYARLRWQAGASERSLQLDGQRIAYLEAGSGPTLVLLHGFTGSKENWLVLMPHLTPHYRVVAPDLPGWGESTRTAGADYGYAAQAERLASLLRQMGGTPVALVGHSMGGGIAAVLAAREPALIDRLVLMDAGGALFRENEFGRAVLRGENPFAVDDRASFDAYLTAVFDDPPFVPWPADRALIARRIQDAAFESAVLDAIGRGPEAFLPAREAERINRPTLLLWCTRDRVVDVSAAAAYAAAIGSSTVRELGGCNHMPMMEQPAATAAALEDFLK